MEMTTEQLDLITCELATIKERSPFYAKKFEGLDVADVASQADFERLPLDSAARHVDELGHHAHLGGVIEAGVVHHRAVDQGKRQIAHVDGKPEPFSEM